MKSEEKNGQEKAFSRRQLLKCSIAAGAGLLVAGKLKVPNARAQQTCDMPSSPASLDLAPYQDPLPIPAEAVGTQAEGKMFCYLDATEVAHQFHSDLPATPMWGFNNTFPGPTIVAYENQTLNVVITNKLEQFHLCVDPRVHGADALFIGGDTPVPYITIHAHGIIDRPESDGDPETRFPPGTSFLYEYPNIQQPATYWYHDHNLGATRLTVHSGLAGFYLLRSGETAFNRDPANLPSGSYEIPMLIQDRSFNEDGTMWYPPPPDDFADFQDEFMGDFITVNGKIWPYLNVKRAIYRFRLLNGSNHTTYALKFVEDDEELIDFVQIGTDGGFLTNPCTIKKVTLASAERADILVDFTNFEPGTEIFLKNDMNIGDVGDKVMKFIVTAEKGPTFTIPTKTRPLPAIKAPVKTRHLSLTHKGEDSSVHLINNMGFMMAPTETPTAGTTEIWHIYNLTDDMHPMHIHQTQFLIMDYQNFDVDAFVSANGRTGPYSDPVVTTTGNPRLAPRNERGLKDTVRIRPGEFVRLKVPFGPFNGRFVWHCHMLEHEDNEMMRPLLIV